MNGANIDEGKQYEPDITSYGESVRVQAHTCVINMCRHAGVNLSVCVYARGGFTHTVGKY